MTIVQLEYFLAVASYGSFSEAARHCFVSQPSLSIQIQNLEEELGVILFNRGNKSVVLTNAGVPILEQARNIVGEFYSMKEMVNELKEGISGRLRLGIVPTVSPYLVPLFVPEFVKKYPCVQLELSDMSADEIVNALDRDLIDVAILSAMEVPKHIRTTKLFTDKLYVYVSPRHELYGRDVIFQSDIDQNIESLIFLSKGAGLRDHRNAAIEAMKGIKVPYSFTTTSLETLMHTVDATSAITIIPGMALDYIPGEKRRQIKVFAHPDAYRTIAMAEGRTCVKKALVDAARKTAVAVAKNFTFPDVACM